MQKGTTLNQRDLAMIRDVARYKYLTSFQLKRLHFDQRKHRTATKRLTELTKAGYLSRVFSYPTARDKRIGHPTAVFYWTPPNQKALQRYLEKRNMADLWDDFEILAATNNLTGTLSQQSIEHDYYLSEYSIALETSAARTGWRVVFCERLHPKSMEFRKAAGMTKGTIRVEFREKTEQGMTTRKEDLPVNPDLFYCLLSPEDIYYFNLHEHERSDKSGTSRFEKKVLGFQAFARQGYFARALSYYIKKYNLPDTIDPDKTYFRVTTTTHTDNRRNILLKTAVQLNEYRRFLFAAMPDITAHLTSLEALTALDAIWIRGTEFKPIEKALEQLPEETSETIQYRELHTRVAGMLRVPLYAN